jgi:hypothetical protein
MYSKECAIRDPMLISGIHQPAACQLESRIPSLSSSCHERWQVVARAPWYPASIAMEERMRELRSEMAGNRRVRLLGRPDGRYAVVIEVRGPAGSWQDISMAADQALTLHTASLCYRLRLVEQESRAIAWESD